MYDLYVFVRMPIVAPLVNVGVEGGMECVKFSRKKI
jgi:hypothetical protein